MGISSHSSGQPNNYYGSSQVMQYFGAILDNREESTANPTEEPTAMTDIQQKRSSDSSLVEPNNKRRRTDNFQFTYDHLVSAGIPTELAKAVFEAYSSKLDGLSIHEEDFFRMEEKAITTLVDIINGSHIETLLYSNMCCPEEGHWILKVLPRTRITSLDFDDGDFGEWVPLSDLAEILPQTQITSLTFRGEGLSKNIDDLVNILPDTQIERLSFNCTGIGDESVINLAEVLSQTDIQALDLNEPLLGDDEIIALAKVLPETQITELGIDVFAPGSSDESPDENTEGIIALAKVLPKTQILRLTLYNSDVLKDASLKVLAQSLPKTQITDFFFADNTKPLGVEGMEALIKALPSTRITSFYPPPMDRSSREEFIKILKGSKITTCEIFGNFNNGLCAKKINDPQIDALVKQNRDFVQKVFDSLSVFVHIDFPKELKAFEFLKPEYMKVAMERLFTAEKLKMFSIFLQCDQELLKEKKSGEVDSLNNFFDDHYFEIIGAKSVLPATLPSSTEKLITDYMGDNPLPIIEPVML